jgi:outer membrane immunogenic protein
MKRFIAAALVIASSPTIALAADMALKAPAPPPPPVLSWTGYYVGANLGGAWSNDPVVVNTTTQDCCPLPFCSGGPATALAAAQGSSGLFSGKSSGVIGGGQFGYNLQLNPTWVAGFETDIQGLNNKSSGSNVLTAPTVGFPGVSVTTNLSVAKEIDYIGTVRGRLGWLATPSLLLYGTGGLAYGGIKTATSASSTLTGYGPGVLLTPATATGLGQTRVGWTAGAGFEWKAASPWSVKLEYLYYDLGSANSTTPMVDPLFGFPVPNYFINNVQTTTRFSGNIVRVGINYQFGGAPLVAKY